MLPVDSVFTRRMYMKLLQTIVFTSYFDATAIVLMLMLMLMLMLNRMPIVNEIRFTLLIMEYEFRLPSIHDQTRIDVDRRLSLTIYRL